jgi:hypothetical protein
VSPGRLLAVRPRNLLPSVGRALRQAGSSVSRAYRERRSSRWPFIVDVLRDSGLVTDLPEEGQDGHLQRRNCEAFPDTNNTPRQEHQSSK